MNLSDSNNNLLKVISISVDYAADAYLNCLEELVKHAKHISVTTPSPHTLFVSGGIDSQAMIYAWKLAEVPFDVVHVNYEGFNLHDRDEIIEFCNAQNIHVNIIDFDLLDFLENRLNEYATKYMCASPQLCTHMAFSEMIHSGTKVFAGNLILREVPLDNTIFGLHRYAVLSGHSVIPFFLIGNERITKASIIKAQWIQKNTNAPNYEFKCEHYRSIGIPIVPQRQKYTGFEMVKCYYDHYPERVTSAMKLRHINTQSKRVFDQLFRNKYLVTFNNHYSPRLAVTETNKTS